jgi:hypothetical protein
MLMSALVIVRCFCRRAGTMFTTSGAISDIELPISQGSYQKRKVSPFPRMKWTEALKNVEVCLSSVIRMVAQGRLAYMH